MAERTEGDSVLVQKMRVHILARELNVSSKVLVTKCQAEGIEDIKNHMSALSAGLEATVREWFSEGAHDTVVETAKRIDLKKVRVKKPKRKTTTKTDKQAQTDATTVTVDAGLAVTATTAVAEAETATATEPALEPTTSGVGTLATTVLEEPPVSQTPATDVVVAAEAPTAEIAEVPPLEETPTDTVADEADAEAAPPDLELTGADTSDLPAGMAADLLDLGLL